MSAKCGFRGEFWMTCRRPDGTVRWRKKFKNGTTTEGLNHVLATQFTGGAQVTTWYIGLINNSGFSALAAADTMASHAGWTELTSYDEAARQAWVEGTPSGGVLASSTVAVFTISATVTVAGAFLTSSNTKGGSTGTLWATGLFDSPEAAVDNDTLEVSYTCTASAA